jgi:hypothetical protein
VSAFRSEAEVRRALERELGRPLAESDWDYLVAKNHVSELIDDFQELEELVATVRELTRFGATEPDLSGLSAGWNVAGDVFQPRSHERALAAALAKVARADEDLRDYRRKEIGDRVLDPEESESWITAHLADEARLGTIGPITLDYQTPRRAYMDVDQGAQLEYLSADRSRTRVVRVRRGGRLDRLRKLSRVLAARYGWVRADAVRFVLSDEPPSAPMLRMGLWPAFEGPTAASRIVLSINVVATPREVAKIYGHARRQLLARTPRRLSDKHLALAEFFTRERVGATWRERMEVWNGEHPDWAYDRPANFSRDCVAAERRILFPPMSPLV